MEKADRSREASQEIIARSQDKRKRRRGLGGGSGRWSDALGVGEEQNGAIQDGSQVSELSIN